MQRKSSIGLWSTCALVGATAVVYLAPQSLVVQESVAAGDGAPDTIELTGTVRDFREWDVPHGHVDFDSHGRGGSWFGCGFGIYAGNVRDTLGHDGKPVFTGAGFRVLQQWETSTGWPICYTMFDAAAGDVEGRKGCLDTGGIDSAASFDSWFRDTPGLNISAPLPITFVRQIDGTYLFDDMLDPVYGPLDGFFPIDGRLFGNSPRRGGRDHNYHFTYELHAKFVYEAFGQQLFRFAGDDDVWVFIDGRKVIDLGGVHPAREQNVFLDRLDLVDGRTYTIDIFFAERQRSQSNIRMELNFELEDAGPLVVTAPYD
jgi:fibro-slime domain-containing protein